MAIILRQLIELNGGEPSQTHLSHITGADPGFFLGGGAPLTD